MPSRPARVCVAAAVAALAAPAAAAESSLRCDGGIVSLGDSRLDLVGTCGRPAYQAGREEVRTTWLGVDARSGLADRRDVILLVERWTYDFGPSRFSYTVTLESGKIAGFDRGERGYGAASGEPPAIPRARCETSALHVGERAYDLVAKCGEPAMRDLTRVREVVAIVPDPGLAASEPRVAVADARATLEIETWAYDFGPRTLVRYVELRDGRIERIETGGYGYSR